MTRRQAWRYKCDHCGRTSGSAGHMKAHELGCTMNPDRVCGCCKATVSTQPNLQGLVAAVDLPQSDGSGASVERVQQLTDCPACILAAIRQATKGMVIHYVMEECPATGIFASSPRHEWDSPAVSCFDWKFREALDAWREEYNELRRDYQP